VAYVSLESNFDIFHNSGGGLRSDVQAAFFFMAFQNKI
jgi:hypothetical protein